MKSIGQKFSVEIQVWPFTALNVVKRDGFDHFNISDIADLQGKFHLCLFGKIIENDAPILNLIEVVEFLYGISANGNSPVPLTIDMEPISYGWRDGDEALITNFKSRSLEHNSFENIIGVLSAMDIGSAIRDATREFSKLLGMDPYLYAFLMARMYKQQGN